METLDTAVEKVRTDMETEIETLRLFLEVIVFKKVTNVKLSYCIISYLQVHLFSDEILCDLMNELEFCSSLE